MSLLVDQCNELGYLARTWPEMTAGDKEEIEEMMWRGRTAASWWGCSGQSTRGWMGKDQPGQTLEIRLSITFQSRQQIADDEGWIVGIGADGGSQVLGIPLIAIGGQLVDGGVGIAL